MKYIGQKSLLTLLIIGIIAASCSKDSQNQYGDDMTYLPISDLVIHPLGDVVFVSYTSESEWIVDVDVDEDWIHFSSENGVPGTTTLNITVDPNIDMDRDAVITFWSGDKKKALDSFVVTQKKTVLDISQKQFDLGWKKEDQNFTVESNIQWKIQLNGEKKDKFAVTSHELDKVAGKIEKDFRPSEEVVTFEPNANNLSDEEDEVAITIVPVLVNGSGDKFELGEDVKEALTTTISISQDYLIFLINDSREDVTLGGFSELGEKYVEEGKVYMDEHVCSQKFTVVSEVDWKFDEAALADVGGRLEEVAEPTDTTIDGRDAKVYTRILHMDEPNPTREVRPYDLKLWAEEDYEAARTVKVEQKPYVLDFDAESVSFVNVGETKTLKVNTTGPWKIENKPEWLTVEPSEGVDSCKVMTIKAPERNLGFEDLTEILKLTSPLVSFNSELEAKQEAFIFKVTEKEALHKMSRLDTTSYEVEINSSGPWELVLEGDDKSWLEIPGIQLEDGKYLCDHGCDTTIKIKATNPNPNKDRDRDMTCKIRSTLHKESGKNWNGRDIYDFGIKQEKFRFDILTGINEESSLVSQTFSSYSPEKNTQSFYLACSAPWEIQSDKEWLKFDKNTGSGVEYRTITMTAENNVGNERNENRPATVTVWADVDGDGTFEEKRIISVTQNKFIFDVKPEKSENDSFDPWDAAKMNVDVYTVDGAGWEVVDVLNAEVKVTTGTGNGSFTFKPTDNGSLDSRKVEVTVKSTVSPDEKTFTYIQNEYEFDSSTEKLTGFDEISSKNDGKEVKVTCSGPWALEDVPEWLEIKEGDTKVTKGSGNATLSFKTVMNNVSLTSNEATVQVVSKVEGATHTKNIKVSQNKYTWEVDGMGGKTLSYDELNEQVHDISVKSSGKWKLSFDKKDDDFFTLNKEEGGPSKISSTDVRLTVKENYTTAPREVTITLKSEHADENKNGELEDILIVKQEPYEYNVPTGDIEFDADGGTKEYAATCSGKLEADSDKDWLHVDIRSGKLEVEVDSHTDTKNDRTGTITIKSEHASKNSALKTTIKVTQKAKKKK